MIIGMLIEIIIKGMKIQKKENEINKCKMCENEMLKKDVHFIDNDYVIFFY